MHSNLRIVLFGILCVIGQAQEIKKCSKIQSTTFPGEIEVHCSCMEKLIEFNEPIRKLTVNQTTCGKNKLKLDWGSLQSYIGVKHIVFDEANIIFESNMNEITNCSVTEVTFLNSFIHTISENAFKQLKLLETVRIASSKINVIESHAFSQLKRLKTIEFANSTIDIIKSRAFIDLPLLDEFAFIKSYIGTLQTRAINLLNQKVIPKEECKTDVRSRMSAYVLMSYFTGRSLSYLQNIKLPSFGSKLLFFLTEIQNINPMSINSNIFSYIIFGGCTIRNFESNALATVIHNECDISSLLLISNNINVLKSEAFANVRGSETEPYNTVIAFIDNIFNVIEPKGFLLHPKIETLHIQGNEFSCKSCSEFSWILSNEASEVQIRLEKELLESGKCKKNLVKFLKSCSDINVLSSHTFLSKDKNNSTFVYNSSSPLYNCDICNLFLIVSVLITINRIN